MTNRRGFQFALALVCGALFVGGGCYGLPLWGRGAPPPDYQQQLIERERMDRFNPYPDNDIGPEMVGVRPPGFDIPRAEPKRARWTRPTNPWRFGR